MLTLFILAQTDYTFKNIFEKVLVYRKVLMKIFQNFFKIDIFQKTSKNPEKFIAKS